jgi:hypothetical protein
MEYWERKETGKLGVGGCYSSTPPLQYSKVCHSGKEMEYWSIGKPGVGGCYSNTPVLQHSKVCHSTTPKCTTPTAVEFRWTGF